MESETVTVQCTEIEWELYHTSYIKQEIGTEAYMHKCSINVHIHGSKYTTSIYMYVWQF